jgi:ABC-type dipeptide/oligopeptide/nickel transport system permease subunit
VPPRWRWARKHPTLIVGALLLIAVAALSIAAPWIATHDPQDIDPLARMQRPRPSTGSAPTRWAATCSAAPCGAGACR